MHDVFYFTDIHGCYDLFRTAMDFCKKQDPECMIIFGGDACDRGKDGYRIMKELLDDPKVIYLKGNHEDMFVRAARFINRDYKGAIDKERIHAYLYSCSIYDFRAVEVQHCVNNGGYNTLKNWMLDGMPMDFVNKLAHLPLTFSYQNLDFCHAGGDYKIFAQVAKNEYYNEIVDKDYIEHVLWDRVHLGMGWQSKRTCIFGHTPVVHLPAKYYGRDKSVANIHPCAYYATLDDKWIGRKIDMDVGTFASGKLYVLNCLTMKAYGFINLEFENDEIRKHDVEQFEVIQF